MILSPPIACIATLHHDRVVIVCPSGTTITVLDDRIVYTFTLPHCRAYLTESRDGQLLTGEHVYDEEALLLCD
jgi:hypothetical protein